MEGLARRSDADLVAGVRNGEELAFGLLFERWFDGVFEAARDALGDPQAAGEVAVETFHALWHHLHQLHDADAFGSWALETSRAFALDRRDTGGAQDRFPPLPLFASVGQMSAAVSGALVARGIPTGAGFAGGVGPAAPMIMGRAVGDGGSAANMAPAGFAGGSGGSGGGILGGSVASTAVAAPVAGVTLATTETFRPHRYEPPKPSVTGALVDSSRMIVGGLAVTTAMVAIGCLLWFVNRDDGGAQVLGQLQVPADTTSTTVEGAGGAAGAQPGDDDTFGANASSLSDDATTSSTSDLPATTPAGPTTTRRSTTTTAIASSTSAATSSIVQVTTSTSTSDPTPTPTSTPESTSTSAEATTSTSLATTSTETTSTSLTSTTPTSSPSTTEAIPEPDITTFRLVRGAQRQCPEETDSYVVVWSVDNATRVEGVIGTERPGSFGPTPSGSRGFCAPSGVSVSITAFGEGGEASRKIAT